jgi:hypothetical protein
VGQVRVSVAQDTGQMQARVNSSLSLGARDILATSLKNCAHGVGWGSL